jgi:CRISPR/Cas system CSM-associated protein Csm3 (group 7 of RAMP superfamily)
VKQCFTGIRIRVGVSKFAGLQQVKFRISSFITKKECAIRTSTSVRLCEFGENKERDFARDPYSATFFNSLVVSFSHLLFH